MNDAVFDPKSTAVLIVDLQNDFLHPDGAYGPIWNNQSRHCGTA